MGRVTNLDQFKAERKVELGKASTDSPEAVAVVSTTFLLRSIARMTEFVGGDIRKAIVFYAIWMASVNCNASAVTNVRRLCGVDTALPVDVFRPVSVMAISASVNFPYESVRRYVEKLKLQGLCSRAPSGRIRIDGIALEQEQESRALLNSNLDHTLTFLSELRSVEFDFRRFAPGSGMQPQSFLSKINSSIGGSVMRACAEFVMRGVDMMSEHYSGDLLLGLVHVTIWRENVGPFFNKAEGRGYIARRERAPNERRRPISVRRLSASVGLPFETTRRYVSKLQRLGMVQVGKKGVIAPAEVFMHPRYADAVPRHYNNTVRLIHTLSRLGVSFAEYCSGDPPRCER